MPLIMDHVFLLLCMPGNLYVDASHCKFYLLHTEYFYISISLIELCSGVQLCNMKQFYPFRSSFLDFFFSDKLGRSQAVFSLGIIILQY